MNAKRKGSRVEREIKKIFEERGLKVVRSAGSLGSADLYVELIGHIQVKARKEMSIYKWLEGNDAVVIKADRQEPLIVLPLQRFLEVL
jgi:Holliday junction resolvase